MATLAPIGTRSETLSEKVYGIIRDAIVSKRFQPGERLTESALAQQLSVSKTPVREALLKLTYVGLIEPDGGRGGRVTNPSYEKIRNAYEVRLGLESQVALIAAERIDRDRAAEIAEIAEKCAAAAQAHDRAGFRAGDRAFHTSLARVCGNGYMGRLVEDAYDLAAALRQRDVPNVGDSVKCAQQHIEVLTAISQQAGDVAALLMRKHISDVRDTVLTALGARTEKQFTVV